MAAMRSLNFCFLVFVVNAIFADCSHFVFASANSPLNLRGGSAVTDVETPEKVEISEEAKKAALDAENYVKEQLEFWNSLTPEQVLSARLLLFHP